MAKKEKWEIRDRVYLLSNGKSPLTYKIKSTGLLYWDEEEGVNREIRYAGNQKSLFVEDQDKNVRVEHIVFEDGKLLVPKNKPLLQQLLSIYHPDKSKWRELDKAKQAKSQVENIETELDAMLMAKELDIDRLEAVMRTELGSDVKRMSSKELRRDAYVFAQKNPELFIELVEDEEIELRNKANLAVESGIVSLTDGNTIFKWKANGRKIMTVPFDQEPYAAFAQFFKTDEGASVLKSIETKLK